MEKGKEKESEQYALWMKTQTDPDTYEKLCKEWFKQIMNIPKNVEVSFNTDPSGQQTSIIVSTKDRVYLVKYSSDYDLEIYNSIRGSLLGISAKMYNVGLFRIPMECFMYLIGLESLSEENMYNLNKTLNEPAYCFEFEKLVDYYDLEEETFLGNQVMLD